jgi:hypothetical protein
MSLPSRLLGANPSIQVSALLSGSLSTPSAKQTFDAGGYESISTTVLSSGSAVVEFTSIPQTYKHLQLRCFAQTNRATYNQDELYMDRVNGSTASTTYGHRLHGSVDTTSNPGSSSYSLYDGVMLSYVSSSVASNVFGVAIVDILDYTNTSKFKTIMGFGGADTNGTAAGYRPAVSLFSGYIPTTSAITSFRLRPSVGSQLNTYSHFALYGMKA